MSADDSFEENRVAELAPSIDDPEGQAYARAMGQEQDAELLVLSVAALCRLPGKCPDDALDGVGRWLAIKRFEGEVDGSAEPQAGYRGRLMRGWTTKKKGGSVEGVTDSLEAWGLGEVTILQNFEVTGGYAGGNYAGFKLYASDFGVYGTGWSPTAAQKRAIVGQVVEIKAAHSASFQLVLTYEGDLLGVDVILGESVLGWTGEVVTILARMGVDFILGTSILGGFEEY